MRKAKSWHKIRQIGSAADWEVYPITPWRLSSWQIVDDCAGPLPVSPVPPQARKLQPGQPVNLIPYGSAKLRIAAFPYMLPVPASK